MSTLKELRTAMGMTQSQVSKIINVAQANYSSYENDTSFPCLEDAVLLEKTFKTRCDWTDNMSEQDKLEITSDIVNLCALYPIPIVITFVQHALKEGIRLGKPGILIHSYSEVAAKITNEVAPLLPPGVMSKK